MLALSTRKVARVRAAVDSRVERCVLCGFFLFELRVFGPEDHVREEALTTGKCLM